MALKLIILIITSVAITQVIADLNRASKSSGNDDIEIKNKSGVNGEATDAVHKDPDEVKLVGVRDPWDETEFRSVFCDDPAEDARRVERRWGPGDEPNTDSYDERLTSQSGCKPRMVPPYDRQTFQRDRLTDSGYEGTPRVLEYRVAMRTVGEGRTDIKIYWNGDKKYYFAFSNTSNTLEFIRYSPWKQLWIADLSEQHWALDPLDKQGRGREHYLPLEFSLGPDHLTFSAGCARSPKIFSARIPTGPTDRVALEIETSPFPAKLLYDCPDELPLD